MRADARRNRQSVLDAAYDILAVEGLGVPIDEIARRAGVGAGTVYRHFPTKESLIEAVVLDRLEALTAKARSGIDFAEFFTVMVEAGLANRAIAEVLASAGYHIPADADAALNAAFAELLQAAQRRGDVRLDVTPDDIQALVIGCVATARHRGATDLVQIVVAGLRA
ncbi:TetR/AcrR family transcriptional regulator [Actinoplanes flavus]|uniref:Helix-turn-helix transcriptional regulator n=1 Tax=Actinoplanes flavus TaxID=2820290 RepID=A0ABS3V094_9ACTN|nr:helix-turn-helix domain-containing protein [Actinoplanes flavus]MBO3744209.1 helix-turn-helix transcriptional regulator [Actinoplanes flavus]